MAKSFINRTLLPVLVLTTITILVWIGLDIYYGLKPIQNPEILSTDEVEFKPDIDEKTLKIIENRLNPTETDFARIPQSRKTKFTVTTPASPAAEQAL